jgi:hypothetical protein
MASSYVNDLRLNEMATGDASGTWGDTTNTNLELIAEAFSYGTEAITTNADTHTTTIADGASDPGRALYLKYTGTLDSACTITIGPNTVSKVWIVENATSGSQNIILSQGSGANITIPAGDTKVVYSDGAGAGAAFFDAFASLSVVDLKVQDDLTVTGDIDVDGTTNLDVVDIDGAVDMASTALVTGVLTTTAATVFNGGFASNAASTISTADNLDTLSLISTDADANSGPNLRLYRNSGSPADSDVLGHIQYEGRNDNSQDVVYSEILTLAADVSDGTEDAIVYIQSMVAGTVRERISILPTEIVLNENSVDLDFRVESDGNANMLFVDGGNNRVGVGTSSPTRPLDVNGSGIVRGFMTLYGTGTDNALFLHNTAYEWAAYTNASNNFVIVDWNLVQTRLTIDTSGNVGIGQASDGDKLHVLGQGFFEDTRANGVGIQINGGSGSEFAHIGVSASNPLTFQTADTERLRIDSSGNLLVGTTSIPTGGASTGFSISDNGGLQMVTHGVSGTTNTYVNIYKNANGTVGGIRVSGSSTAYDTSSDYRLKENVVTDWDATTRLKQLKPSRFNFIADADTTVDGFLAHEVQDIVPEAISGTKDAMRDEEYEVTPAALDDDGNVVTEAVMGTRSVPDYQSIDQSKLVPLLVKTIQELEARITTLENA